MSPLKATISAKKQDGKRDLVGAVNSQNYIKKGLYIALKKCACNSIAWFGAANG